MYRTTYNLSDRCTTSNTLHQSHRERCCNFLQHGARCNAPPPETESEADRNRWSDLLADVRRPQVRSVVCAPPPPPHHGMAQTAGLCARFAQGGVGREGAWLPRARRDECVDGIAIDTISNPKFESKLPSNTTYEEAVDTNMNDSVVMKDTTSPLQESTNNQGDPPEEACKLGEELRERCYNLKRHGDKSHTHNNADYYNESQECAFLVRFCARVRRASSIATRQYMCAMPQTQCTCCEYMWQSSTKAWRSPKSKSGGHPYHHFQAGPNPPTPYPLSAQEAERDSRSATRDNDSGNI